MKKYTAQTIPEILKKHWEVKKKLKEINSENDWIADWGDPDQKKYYVYYDSDRATFDFWWNKAIKRQHFYMCEQAKDYFFTLSTEDKQAFLTTKTTNLEPEEEIISSLSEIIKYLKKGKPTGKEKEKLEDAKEKAELLISEITKHTQKWRERKTEKEILELSKKNPGLLLGGVQRQ